MSGFIIAALVLFIPGLFKNAIFFDFRPYVLLGLLSILFFSHPKMSFEKLGSDGKSSDDKRSMLFINLSFYLTIIPIYYYYIFFIQAEQTLLFPNLIEIIGISIGLFGLLFRWWSIHVLGKWFTSEVVIQNEHQLIKSGPYRYLRHPGYTGALLFGFTPPLILRCPNLIVWSLAILIPAYIYRIHVEEKALSRQFGQEYINYIKTSNAVIPFIW